LKVLKTLKTTSISGNDTQQNNNNRASLIQKKSLLAQSLIS